MGNRFESLDQELGELARGIAQRRGLTKEVLQAQTAAETEALLSGDARPYRPERVPESNRNHHGLRVANRQYR